jgi:hypothetical protein
LHDVVLGVRDTAAHRQERPTLRADSTLEEPNPRQSSFLLVSASGASFSDGYR